MWQDGPSKTSDDFEDFIDVVSLTTLHQKARKQSNVEDQTSVLFWLCMVLYRLLPSFSACWSTQEKSNAMRSSPVRTITHLPFS